MSSLLPSPSFSSSSSARRRSSISSSTSTGTAASSVPPSANKSGLRRPSNINLAASAAAHSQAPPGVSHRNAAKDNPPPPPRPPPISVPPSGGNDPAAPQVGDRVRVAGMDYEGILKFWGEVKGKKGTWAGVDLQEKKGKNDGSAGGVRYFTCLPEHGIFCQAEKVSLIAPSSATSFTSTSTLSRTMPRSATPEMPPPLPPGQSSINPSTPSSHSQSSGVTPRPSRSLRYSTSGGFKELSLLKTSVPKASSTRSATERENRPPPTLPPNSPSSSATGSVTSTARRSRPSSPDKRASSPTKGNFGMSTSSNLITPRANRTTGGSGRPSGASALPGLGSSIATPGARTIRKSIGPGARPSAGGNSAPSTVTKGRQSEGIPAMPSLPSTSTSMTNGSGRSTPGSAMSANGFGDRAAAASTSRPNSSLGHSHSQHSQYSRKASETSRPNSSLSMSSNHKHHLSRRPSESAISLKSSIGGDPAPNPFRPDSRASSRASIALEANMRDLKSDFEEERRKLQMDSDSLKKEMSDLKVKLGERDRELVELRMNRDNDRERKMMEEKNGKSREDGLKKELEDMTAECGRLNDHWIASQARVNTLETRLKELEESINKDKDSTNESQTALNSLLAAKDEELAAKDKEILEAKARSEEISQSFSTEREELEHQLEELREAGQALCGVYEERIAGSEEARIEAEENNEKLEEELKKLKDDLLKAQTDPSGLAEMQKSAAMIDNETLRSEVEHMKGRISSLDEQLEEARAHLENEMADTKRRRQKSGETESALRKEVKIAREQADRSTKAEERAAARSSELEEALLESQIALENERAEVERLRQDAQSTGSLSLDGELKKMQKLLEKKTVELDEAKEEVEKLRHRQQGQPLTSPLLSGNHELSPGRSGKRDSSASSSSKKSFGSGFGRDDVSALKEQIQGYKILIESLTDENKKLEARLGAEGSQQPNGTSISNGSEEEVQRKIDEISKKNAREIKALNQEVADLEALVESKIFKEEQLESDLANSRQLLHRARELGFVDADSPSGLRKASSLSKKPASPPPQVIDDEEPGACELCGETGHSLEHCPIFSGADQEEDDDDRRRSDATAGGGERLYCENCEKFGSHSTADCTLTF